MQEINFLYGTFTVIFRFVGYLEEEAVITYTHIIQDIDRGSLPMLAKLPAPDLAVKWVASVITQTSWH